MKDSKNIILLFYFIDCGNPCRTFIVHHLDHHHLFLLCKMTYSVIKQLQFYRFH
ncbi:hypothetical protein C5167_007379 [Papaver somniferum]|nr:hypothetical protein C5167_007379 [Papaver somniferum]